MCVCRYVFRGGGVGFSLKSGKGIHACMTQSGRFSMFFALFGRSGAYQRTGMNSSRQSEIACSSFHYIPIVGVGKREEHKTWSMMKPEKTASVLSAVSAIGTPLRDPINSGLTRWRLTVYVEAAADSGRNPVSKHQVQPECGE